jgi:rubrerythrin
LNNIKIASFLLYSQAEKYCKEFNRFVRSDQEKMLLKSDNKPYYFNCSSCGYEVMFSRILKECPNCGKKAINYAR